MKKTRRVRRMLFLIAAFVLTLGACAPAARPEPDAQAEIISGRIMIVDSESSALSPHLPEYPPAGDESAVAQAHPQAASQEEELPKVSQSDSASAPSVRPEASSGDLSTPAAPQATPADTLLSQEPSTLSSSAYSSETQAAAASQMVSAAAPRRVSVSGEVRGVWISYLELDGLLRGKSKSQFTANIRAVFDNCKSYGLNTVIVHVRPFADALYSSEYFPWSYLCTGTEGVSPGFDPLKIMVDEAHARNLSIEAWLNPYRIRAQGSKNAISADNQASAWISAGDSAVIRYNGVTSYNPASSKARELIVSGAREIVRNYDVDGVHIDDYFYPTTDAAFDAPSYNAYKNGGGSLSLADWRRQNVETLIKALYAAVKAENPDARFGISPQSSVYNNYNAMYLDVAKISGNAGYCDYICPQIYFGYQNAAQPYQKTIEEWNRMVNPDAVDLYVGLAAYKSGLTDSWAGAGKEEWRQNTDLLQRMVQSARAQNSCKGFALYRYDSIFNPAAGVKSYVDKEYKNLKSIL